MAAAVLVPLLRRAVADGEYAALGELLDPHAALRSSSERGRRTVEGPAAIVEHLERPGPGEVTAWDAREWPTGAAVTFEWRGAAGHDRRRWYVRRDEATGRVTGLWSYAARPRGDGGATTVPDAVLAALGAGARRAALEHGGNSGAALERIVLGDGTALVAKHVAPGADWLGRATADRGRTAQLWRAGAFARMPAVIEHGIVAVAPDPDAGGGAWVLMHDLSDHLLDDHRMLSREESRAILAAAATVHATFRGDPPAGAATLRDRLGMSGLAVAEAERAGPDLLPKQFEAAWDAFAEAVDDDVAQEILAAVADPGPLAAALAARAPATLLHGDLRDDNLGFDAGRLVLLDWDLATAGTPSVELAWYLCHDAWRIAASHDEIEADFRSAEAHVDPVEAELGIASGLVQYGWIFGHSALVHPDPAEAAWAREELAWWVPRVRRALEATGGLAARAPDD